MSEVNDLLSKMTDFLTKEVKTETLIGQPFQAGEYTCVPIMKVGMGFGVGEGKEPTKGGTGGAAGIGMQPIGFLASRGEDIRFIPANNSKGFDAVLEKMPDVLERYLQSRKKGEEESK